MDSNHCPRAYKARALPTELRYRAFAGTLDLHYYRASTMPVIKPTLNPAKFIPCVQIGHFIGNASLLSPYSSRRVQSTVTLNLMSTARPTKKPVLFEAANSRSVIVALRLPSSTRYPPVITLLICFSVWSGRRDLNPQKIRMEI